MAAATNLSSRKKPGLTPAEKEERNTLIEEYGRIHEVLLSEKGAKATFTSRHTMMDMHPSEIRELLRRVKSILLKKKG